MEQIIYGLTAVIYSIFIIRFILSWVGGDFDIDIDTDADLDLGDLVSFKGATHFLMGLSGWLSIKLFVVQQLFWYDYVVAVGMGLIFVTILFYLYKFMLKLECKPILLTGRQLIGKSAKIYLYCGIEGEFRKYLITVNNGLGTVEIPSKTKNVYGVGDMVTITDYQNSYYII